MSPTTYTSFSLKIPAFSFRKSLTFLIMSVFLVLLPLTAPVRVRAQAQREEDEEMSQTQLVRSGGTKNSLTGTNIIAITVLFTALVAIGLHAYTTQIYPHN